MADAENAVTTGTSRPVRYEVATVLKDITHPYMGVLLYSNDQTLRTRGGLFGYQIYDELERDDQVLSCMNKRKNALTAYPWMLEAASDKPEDVAARDMVERHLKGFRFNRMVKALMDAILKGFSVGEIMWDIGRSPASNGAPASNGVGGGDEIRPVAVKARDQRRFSFDTDYRLRMRTWSNMMPGDIMPERKFIVHAVGAKDENPYGMGLGAALFWYVFFKRQNLTFWNTYNDKYSQPTAVGKYPNGTERPDIDNLLAAIDAIARETGVAIPEGMSIEYLEAQRSGTIDAYERLWEKCDGAISKIILGETLTTDIGDTGSYAAAETHNGVRLELVQGDTEELADTLNQTLIAWDVAFNMPNAQPPKISWEVKPPEDSKASADTDAVVASMGFELDEETINRKYGPGWTKKAAPDPAKIQVPFGGALSNGDSLSNDGANDPTEFSETRDPIGQLVGRLNDAAAPAIGAMIETVRGLVGSAGSLADIRDGLLTLYPDISPAAFSEAMSQALLTADLAGRAEIAR